jgi:hypothetical protein
MAKEIYMIEGSKNVFGTEEKIMSCPYFRESDFGICVALNAIHVPSIDEMERFCFRSSYSICPNLTLPNGPEKHATVKQLCNEFEMLKSFKLRYLSLLSRVEEKELYYD